MKMKQYTGIMTALVTPLTKENTIDESKLKKLIDFQIEKGVSSLLILGGTGEYSALSEEVRVQAVKARSCSCRHFGARYQHRCSSWQAL